MKIHRPIANQIIRALHTIFSDGYYADKVIERLFKDNRQLGARDRRFIAENVYEIVRWWRLLWTVLEKDQPSLEEPDLWRLLGVSLLIQNPDMTLPTWPEFSGLTRDKLESRLLQARKIPAVRESVPDWLYDLGKKELGENWDSALSEMNRQAPAIIRTNRLKTTRDELAKKLRADDIDTRLAPETEDGLILTERKNLFTTEVFKLGYFELQDGASQQIAPMLDVQPGHRVIDACAGAGGKSLHIAALLKNKGKLISMDIFDKKLIELRRRAVRAGVDVIETKLIESNKTIKRLEKSADRVLLDVPCSGLGVLRRNPDAKWKLKLHEIEALRITQASILKDYAVMTKPGGLLVYATCSILPSENELQVQTFLGEHPQWRMVREKKFWPGQNGFDGFYAATLQRTAP